MKCFFNARNEKKVTEEQFWAITQVISWPFWGRSGFFFGIWISVGHVFT